VPNAFTPNGDGLNDDLYPVNALSLNDLDFRVFNRFGQLIFESRDAAKKWDGKLNGQMQPTEPIYGCFVIPIIQAGL
jgi:gliding motility-associated-like protein